MHKLYEELEKAKGIGNKQKVIRDFFDKTDIGSLLRGGDLITGPLQGGKILPDTAVNSGYEDHLFVVGEKYCRDEPYADGPFSHVHKFPAYVLAFVYTSGDTCLLVVEPDSINPYLTRRDRLLPHVLQS